VKLVVPSGAGGGTDFYARLLAQALGDAFGQQFVVENLPGGSGNVGAAAAARASPDGYTFLVAADPALSVNQSLFKNLPYDPERDFVPVARGVTVPLVICVQPALGIRTLGELVERGKRAPRALTYGSSGSGAPNALAVRIIEEASGARFLHVPYRGMGMALPALLAGQVDFLLPDVAIVVPHLKSGRLVALAVTHRTAQLPHVPSIAAAGFPDFSMPSNFSVVAPAGTPRAIVERLNGELNKALASDDVRKRLALEGAEPVPGTPEDYAADIDREETQWAKVVKASGAKAE
jgi:tripartite-type tricarboxylate transporter receptor subunit TctC